jgi:hypothetical protein
MPASVSPWISILAVLAVALSFWYVLARFQLLRDAKAATVGAAPAFSLSRTQLLFWTFNVLCAFLLIVIRTGYPDHPTAQVIPNQALILMGISIGTSFGSSIIDTTNVNATDTTGSFWKDLLSADGARVDIHRFQLAIWTMVGGALFWFKLLENGCTAIPEFDTGLLALMGISGTAYLGLKAHE